MKMTFEKNTTSVEDIDIKKIAKICIDTALSNLDYDLAEDPEYYGIPDFYNGEYADPSKCIEDIIEQVAKYFDKYENEVQNL